jgi:hypothetical protein
VGSINDNFYGVRAAPNKRDSFRKLMYLTWINIGTFIAYLFYFLLRFLHFSGEKIKKYISLLSIKIMAKENKLYFIMFSTLFS